MNNLSKNSILFVLAFLPLIGILIHYFYLRPAIVYAYQGESDAFIKIVLDTLYPRFYVEKERFDLAFFLTKADQVIYRSSIVYYCLLSFLYFYKKKEYFQERANAFFYTETNVKSISVLRIIFFSYFIYLSYELVDELIAKQSLRLFYKPFHFLSLANIPFPNTYTIITIGIIWTSLHILIILNKKTLLCTILSLTIFLLCQCWTFSFEKTDHGYATITYVFLLFPFLLDEQTKNTLLFKSWSLQLMRISIAMVYLLSSLEKIVTSQFSWLNPDNLKTYLSFHETALSKIVIQSDVLCFLFSVGSITIQLSFILIVFFPRLKWIWIIGGIIFHTGTLLLMNIGILLNPWILVYIFFFDWANVYDFFSDKFRKEKRFSN